MIYYIHRKDVATKESKAMYSVTRTKATKRDTPVMMNDCRSDWIYETVEITKTRTAKRGWELATEEYKTGEYDNTETTQYSWDVRKI